MCLTKDDHVLLLLYILLLLLLLYFMYAYCRVVVQESCVICVQVAYACPLQGTVFAKLTHVPEMNIFHRGLLVSHIVNIKRKYSLS